MTHDGFTLLVMGFTGKVAMAWKEKYIWAFNAMRDRLSVPAAVGFSHPSVMVGLQGHAPLKVVKFPKRPIFSKRN